MFVFFIGNLPTDALHCATEQKSELRALNTSARRTSFWKESAQVCTLPDGSSFSSMLECLAIWLSCNVTRLIGSLKIYLSRQFLRMRRGGFMRGF